MEITGNPFVDNDIWLKVHQLKMKEINNEYNSIVEYMSILRGGFFGYSSKSPYKNIFITKRCYFCYPTYHRKFLSYQILINASYYNHKISNAYAYEDEDNDGIYINEISERKTQLYEHHLAFRDVIYSKEFKIKSQKHRMLPKNQITK